MKNGTGYNTELTCDICGQRAPRLYPLDGQSGTFDDLNKGRWACSTCEEIETRKTTFKEIKIGQCFKWLDVIYKKVEYNILPHYGRVSMVGPKFYNGDTGHRFLEDDRIVEPV